MLQFNGFGNQGVEVGNACSDDETSSGGRYEPSFEIVNLVIIALMKDGGKCFKFSSKDMCRAFLLKGIILTMHLFHVECVFIEGTQFGIKERLRCENGVVWIGTAKRVCPSGRAIAETRNDEGDLVSIIIEEYREFVVKIEFAIADEGGILDRFTIEYR